MLHGLEERVLRRWVVFNLVGCTGFLVQVAVLAGLTLSGLHYMIATMLAVEAAVLNNFVWHERWTWRDRTNQSPQTALTRLLRFNATVGVISIGENLTFMGVLVEFGGLHYIVANMVSIAICSLVNFLISNRLVFRRCGTLVPPCEETV